MAAACDLAIADTGFKTAVSKSGNTLLASLFNMYHKALIETPKDVPEGEGLFSLALYQLIRVSVCKVGAHPALYSICICSRDAGSLRQITPDLALSSLCQCFTLLIYWACAGRCYVR